MKFTARVIRAYREQGLVGFVSKAASFVPWLLFDQLPWRMARAYKVSVRPRLPEIGYAVCNEVVVARPRKLLDPLVPRHWLPENVVGLVPLYEHALVTALGRHLREGERVVVIGGGYGVTAVTAARAVGRTGSVVCYEAVAERVADLETALRLNRVETPVQVEHAIVAHAISLYGDGWDAPVVSPAELPECDVLEMDCEGAELEILAGLRIRPRLIIVETHGVFGAPTAEVRRLLEGLAYRVEDVGVAEVIPEQARYCSENDVRVLVAHAPDAAEPRAAGEATPRQGARTPRSSAWGPARPTTSR
jgi:hypothetical protein